MGNLCLPVPLAERLKERIRREGPVTFHDWMEAALYDPVDGYYRRSDLVRWGRGGDYRTSPERSELFAATFARYFAKLYDDLERPRAWVIVECGAGDGRFAEGVLRELAEQFPHAFETTRYVVCDSSPDALARARARLSLFHERVEFCSESELPRVERGVFFSNELLDAFPVHRLIMSGDELLELYVALDADDNFQWTTGQLSSERLSDYALELVDGQIVEINLGIEAWFGDVAAKLRKGYVISVDYGSEADELFNPLRRPKGTLRAFSKHGFVDDLLARPGEYDITASVNWTQVMNVGDKLGLEIVKFTAQDRFLLDAGLLDVMKQHLAKTEGEAAKLSLTTGAREMILPSGMGASFQVLVQVKS